jgi:hypothetical protein
MRLKIMSPHGHDVQELDKLDATEKFKALVGEGFLPAVPKKDAPGELTIVREFPEEADEVLFVPQLVGG